MRHSYVVIAAITAQLITGCGEPAPALPTTQQALYDEAAHLAKEFEAANESGNDLRRQQATATIDRYQAKKRIAQEWRAVVDEVHALDNDVWIDADQGIATFHLKIIDPAVKTWAATLTRGTVLKFDGDIGPERSFSHGGALGNPEFMFWPTAIAAEGGATYQQSAALIADAIAAAERERFEDMARGAVAAACEKAVLRKLDIPHQASFSWLRAQASQLESGKWGYKNRVDIKNRFGATLTRDVLCVADVSRDDDGKPVAKNAEATIM